MTIASVPEYTGAVPLRTQSQATFNTNVADMLSYIDSYVPALNDTIDDMNTDIAATNINTATASAAAASAIATTNATVYNSGSTYDFPDTVIGSDGNTYRATEAVAAADDPVTSTTGKWLNITADIGSNPNLIINPTWGINQPGYVYGTDTATTATYFTDGWYNKTGNSSRVISFSGTNGIIPGADGIEQNFGKRRFDPSGTQLFGPVEGEDLTVTLGITSGTIAVYAGYDDGTLNPTLSFVGNITTSVKTLTFQADYNSVSTNVLTIDLRGTGVIKWIKVERGSKSTQFNYPLFSEELDRCKVFWRSSYNHGVKPGTVTDAGSIDGRNTAGGASSALRGLPCKIERMDSNPTISIYSTNTGTIAKVYDITATADVTVSSITGNGETGFTQMTLGATIAQYNAVRFHYVFDARL